MSDLRTAFNIPTRIFLLTMLLAGIGVVMVYSSSANYVSLREKQASARRAKKAKAEQEALPGVATPIENLAPTEIPESPKQEPSYHKGSVAVKQLLAIAVGLVALIMAYHLDYTRLKAWSLWFLIFSAILLVLVWVPGIRDPFADHYRWIRVPPFKLQPSEFAKLALIIYMARMLNDHHDKIGSLLHGVMPAMALTGVFAYLIVSEPDIGATVVMTSIILLMWFIGGMRIRHLFGLVLVTASALVFVILSHPKKFERILAFVNPTADSSQEKIHQLNQSLIAVGSGGLGGVGLGNSMQKHFLSEQFSDFIFSIVSEELGFIGAAFIILCYFLLIWQGWSVALKAPDFFASLLASGITLMLTINVTLNLMVVLGMAPTKGLVLPLLSAGGSNILVTMTSMGILMNIGAYVEQEEGKAPAAAKSAPSRAARVKSPKRGRKWTLWGEA